jgi:transposase
VLIEHKQKQEKDRIDWRRNKIQELSSQGHSQREIAQILQVSNGTVNKDLSYLRRQAKSNIRRYIDERLPEEYEKCLLLLIAAAMKTTTKNLKSLIMTTTMKSPIKEAKRSKNRKLEK